MISTHSSKRSTHTGPVGFLYNNLTPREFEKMLCLLFKQHIVAKKAPYCHQYDDVHLMTGVGEKGRDISLSLTGESVGLVQCKREKNNLSDVACAREVIKFALNAICSPQLIANRDRFTYYLTASTGFSVRRQMKVDKMGENGKRQFSKLFHPNHLSYVQID